MSDEKKNEEPIKKADKAFKDVLAGVRLGTDEEIAERDAEIARMETERLKESRESMFLRSGIAEKRESFRTFGIRTCGNERHQGKCHKRHKNL